MSHTHKFYATNRTWFKFRTMIHVLDMFGIAFPIVNKLKFLRHITFMQPIGHNLNTFMQPMGHHLNLGPWYLKCFGIAFHIVNRTHYFYATNKTQFKFRTSILDIFLHSTSVNKKLKFLTHNIHYPTNWKQFKFRT